MEIDKWFLHHFVSCFSFCFSRLNPFFNHILYVTVFFLFVFKLERMSPQKGKLRGKKIKKYHRRKFVIIQNQRPTTCVCSTGYESQQSLEVPPQKELEVCYGWSWCMLRDVATLTITNSSFLLFHLTLSSIWTLSVFLY